MKLKYSDIEDAFKYLQSISNGEIDKTDFIEKCQKEKIKTIPIDSLKNAFVGNNNRRPKKYLENPIIVMQAASGEMRILDGNHRYLQHLKNNKKFIKGIIVKMNNIHKKKISSFSKSFYVL